MGFIDDNVAAAGAGFGQSALERGRAAAWQLCKAASFVVGRTVSVQECQLSPLPTMRHPDLLVDVLNRVFKIPRVQLDRSTACYSSCSVAVQVAGNLLLRSQDGARLCCELQRLAGWLVSFTAAVPCDLLLLRELFAVAAAGPRHGLRVGSVASTVVQAAATATH